MRVLRVTPVPSSPLHSILSSASSSPSPSPSTPGASRRGRTASADGRPKKGDADYVKRPENAFILFRRQVCAEHAGSSSSSSSPAPSSPPSTSTSSSPLPTPAPITLVGLPAKARQADLSKAISAQWRALSAEERAKWEAMAAEKKREHEEKYPGYVYRPRKKPPRGSTNAELERMSLTPTPMPPPRLEFVLPAPRLPLPRSSSVPPPPHPYHTIQIPNVYAGGYHTYSPFTASSSSSPPTNQAQDFSLLPMIMASASKRESTNTSGFDYLLAAAEAGNTMSAFEANLMTSDFLRSMFTNPNPNPTPLDTPLELSPASSPEPELATPGPGPGPLYNAPPQDCSPQQPTWPAAYPLALPHSHSHLDANAGFTFDSPSSQSQMDFGFGVGFDDFALGSVPPPSFGEFQGWDMPVGELDMDMDMDMDMGMDMGMGMEAWDGVDPMQLQGSGSGS
ncbi:hypothetical protein C8F01DRAFT_161434 [Mycena amicta]|nr:hypothetical protein C8F01DRAFT_161434 [Mycena amicta]